MKTTSNEQLQEAQEYFFKRQFDKAYTLLTTIITQDATHSVAYFWLARTLSMLNKDEDAILNYQFAIQYDENYALAYAYLGLMFPEQENNNYSEKAIQLASQSIERNPECAESYLARGFAYRNLYCTQNDNEYQKKVIEDYTSAITLNPKNAMRVIAYGQRGSFYFQFSRYEKAIEDYTSAIALTPEYYLYYCYRGDVYKSRADYDNFYKTNYAEAIKDYTKAIELNPNDSESYCARARAYYSSGFSPYSFSQFGKSIQDFIQGFKLSNEHSEERKEIISQITDLFFQRSPNSPLLISLQKDKYFTLDEELAIPFTEIFAKIREQGKFLIDSGHPNGYKLLDGHLDVLFSVYEKKLASNFSCMNIPEIIQNMIAQDRLNRIPEIFALFLKNGVDLTPIQFKSLESLKVSKDVKEKILTDYKDRYIVFSEKEEKTTLQTQWNFPVFRKGNFSDIVISTTASEKKESAKISQ